MWILFFLDDTTHHVTISAPREKDDGNLPRDRLEQNLSYEVFGFSLRNSSRIIGMLLLVTISYSWKYK